MVIGLLAILKAGGAYAARPRIRKRLAFMLEDAQVSVLLAGTASGTSSTRAMVVCLDTD